MRFLINILITAVVVYILSKLLVPHVAINSFTTAIIFAFVLAILNFIVKPLLILLTLPITIITLGLFLLIINIIIFMARREICTRDYDTWLFVDVYFCFITFNFIYDSS